MCVHLEQVRYHITKDGAAVCPIAVPLKSKCQDLACEKAMLVAQKIEVTAACRERQASEIGQGRVCMRRTSEGWKRSLRQSGLCCEGLKSLQLVRRRPAALIGEIGLSVALMEILGL